MIQWDEPASETVVQTTVAALKQNNIEALVVENGAAAFKKVLEIIPKGAEVMNMSSVTIDTIGLAQELNESGNFVSVRKIFATMTKDSDALPKQKLGAAPEWAIGSVHAVTEDGKVMIASQSGSQLPAYSSGSLHVVWVVGTQKIVKDLNAAWSRVHDYVLPRESERARKAYNLPADKPGSAINKLLTINKENKPGRITIIFVKEILGF